jgi:hypothetical protein
MNLTHACWRPSFLAGLTLSLALTGAAELRAQGFGADPFRPYNSQYDPYTYPMGPALPEAGQSMGGAPRSGLRGANQYQNYLDELQGTSRQGAERYGIGSPYYRSSVDSSLDPNGTREYRPNFNQNRTYEQTQALVTQKYIAYFAEKDPKKKAALLKEYNQTRGRVSRALSTRRQNQTRALNTAAGLPPEAPERDNPIESNARATKTNRPARTGDAGSTARAGTREIPPAPPLFGTGGGRAAGRQRTPEEVLNRARRLNSDADVKSSPGAAPNARSTNARRPPADTPSSPN